MRPFVTTREYATEIGAIGQFEEKYGEFVRVLEIDDFSRELCGGTHVSSTSQIGLFKITSSQSVGANTRRIEAITSAAAVEHYRGLEHEWDALAADLKVRPDRVTATVEKLAAQVRDLETKLKAAESGERKDLAAELLASAVQVGGITLVAGSPEVDTADQLLTLVDEVRGKEPRLRRAAGVGRRRSRGGGGRRRRRRGRPRRQGRRRHQGHAAGHRRQGRRQAHARAGRRVRGRRRRRGTRSRCGRRQGHPRLSEVAAA